MPADTSAGMWIKKGSAAMLTSIQSSGVTPEVNLRNLLCAGEGIHPGFETQARRHAPEVQNRGFSGDLYPPNFF